MNSQVDIIVIGDSSAGHDIVKRVASTKPSIKMAFISREFKNATTHDYLNVEYIKDEVIFTDYKNRLFGVYLKSGARVYCTHLVIASGLSYEPLMLNHKQVPNVYNNIDDIPKAAKNQPAIVLVDNNADVKFALNVAKKYKQVYLCTKTVEVPDLTPANKNKLSCAENIVVLPNTSVVKFQANEGILQKVELDTYSTVTCSAIFVKTKAKPETDFVSNICGKTTDNFLVTSNEAQSLLVPKCFAIGNCAAKYTQKMRIAVVEAILKDF